MSEFPPTQLIGEVISIGDELTSGQRLDTNSQWLSQQLAKIGISTRYHSTVADDVDAMLRVFQNAIARSNIVLVTGGLGPTADDLTRQVVAQTAGVDLILDESMLQRIRDLFESRGRQMPETNRVQALFPAGSQIIENHMGTAPGVEHHFPDQNCTLFAFPGVPAELKPMWTDDVRQRIRRRHPNLGLILQHSIHCFGLAESDVETRLPDIIKRGREPTVGITATKATITLRISASGQNEAACRRLIEPTAQLIREELSEFVFGENGQTLQQVVVQLLKDRQQTLSIVDVGGCGLIADWMQQVDPQGDHYLGMLSFAASSARVGNEDLPKAEYQSLALKAANFFGSDIVLVIGPAHQHAEDGLKRQFLISRQMELTRTRVNASSNPSIVVPRSIKQALNFLRLKLEREPA